MSTMTKVFVVLTCVMAIVVSCLTVAVAAQWPNLRETLDSYQKLYEAEMASRVALQGTMYASLAMKDDQIRGLQGKLTAGNEQIRDLSNQLASIRNELARRTNELEGERAGVIKLREILDVQTQELTSTQKNYQELFAKNIELETRSQRQGSRIIELNGQLTIAIDQNRNLQEKLYAEQQRSKDLEQMLATGRRAPAAGEPPAGAIPVSPAVVGEIRGEIVEVDGNYVSINIGETSGVAVNMPFMVYRSNEYLGDLEVQTVRPKEAGGKLTFVKADRKIAVGDRVVYGLAGK